jgi:hypothetical protein
MNRTALIRARVGLTSLRRRLPTTRRARVLAIQCARCNTWFKPRHLSLPGLLCRRCQHEDYLAARTALVAQAAARQTIRPAAQKGRHYG